MSPIQVVRPDQTRQQSQVGQGLRRWSVASFCAASLGVPAQFRHSGSSALPGGLVTSHRDDVDSPAVFGQRRAQARMTPKNQTLPERWYTFHLQASYFLREPTQTTSIDYLALLQKTILPDSGRTPLVLPFVD